MSILDRPYSQLACLLQVCFNFKQQQTILCLLQDQSEKLKAVRNGQHLELGKDIIDIRIAQFLLTPNSPNVTDSPELDTVLQEVAFLLHKRKRIAAWHMAASSNLIKSCSKYNTFSALFVNS